MNRICACFAAALCVAAVRGAERTELSLNGQWQTVLTESHDELPGSVQWKPTQVPGDFMGLDGEKRWLRRTFDVPAEWRGRRVHVVYDGVKFDSRHLVNGRLVGRHFRGYDRFEIDLTPGIRFGQDNELLVGCSDWQATFEKPVDMTDKPRGNTSRGVPRDVGLTPIGGRFYHYGIWADVKLVAVAPIHVSDVTVRTSVRQWRMDVQAQVRNAGAAAATASVEGRVVEAPGLRLKAQSLRLAPGESKTVRWRVPWSDPKLWGLKQPNLYHLDVAVRAEKAVLDTKRTRFGFREFWCEGSYFFLNGTRLLLRATSMWPLSPPDKAAAAAHLRKFDNIHAICFRTHTQPWRQYWYDAADEVGILMIPEGPVFNDDYLYKLGDQRFWDNYAAELHSMVQRVKNNPSVVMYSLENEFWGGRMNDESPFKPQLVRMGELMREYDPTRPFMYESDGDPGRVADVVGIHYPHEMGDEVLYPNTCYWMDKPKKRRHEFTNGADTWLWDRKKPMYIGEYLWCPCPTPARYTVFFGDVAYRDYRRYQREAIGLSWSMQTRVYRYYRVSGLCPWTCAGGSLDVAQDPMAAGQAESMRPLAAFVKEYDRRFYAGAQVSRTLHVMNDTLHAGQVAVSWEFAPEGQAVQRGQRRLDMEPADLRVERFRLTMPAVAGPTAATLTVRAEMPKAPTFQDVIRCEVHPRPALQQPQHKLTVLGRDAAEALRRAGLSATELSAGQLPDPASLLVVGRDAAPKRSGEAAKVLRVGEGEGGAIQRFVERGGRVLMLSQTQPHDPVGAVAFVPRQATMVFPLTKQHPVLAGIQDDDLKFWAPDHIVVDAQVNRTDCAGQTILVSGSSEGIAFSPLAECRMGRGVVLACGLRLLAALEHEPVAARMLGNALGYLDRWQPDPRECVAVQSDDGLAVRLHRLRVNVRPVAPDAALSPDQHRLVVCGASVTAAAIGRLVASYVEPGGTMWWHRPEPEAFAEVMKRLGIEAALLPCTGPVNLNWDDPFADGLAQADLWWVGEGNPNAPSWAGRPRDPGIIDREVGVQRRIDLGRARAASCLDMKVTGSKWNQPQGEFVVLASRGSVIGEMDFGAGGVMLLGLRGKGSPAAGVWPRVVVLVGGQAVGHVNVVSREPATYAVRGQFPPGRHEVELRFVNDMQIAGEDRNVYLSHVYVQPDAGRPERVVAHASPAALASIPVGQGTLLVDTIKWGDAGEHADSARAFASSLLVKFGAHPRAFALASMEAEDMRLEEVIHNRLAATEAQLANVGSLWAKVVVERPGRYTLRVFARGKVAADEWPILAVKLEGQEVGEIVLRSPVHVPFDLPIVLPAGDHDLELRFTNDYYEPGVADRNAYVDKVEVWPAE